MYWVGLLSINYLQFSNVNVSSETTNFIIYFKKIHSYILTEKSIFIQSWFKNMYWLQAAALSTEVYYFKWKHWSIILYNHMEVQGFDQ